MIHGVYAWPAFIACILQSHRHAGIAVSIACSEEEPDGTTGTAEPGGSAHALVIPISVNTTLEFFNDTAKVSVQR